MESIIKKFRRLSNEQLFERINNAPDFGWDDEGWELSRRIEKSNDTLKCEMQGNKIVILTPEAPKEPVKAKFEQFTLF